VVTHPEFTSQRLADRLLAAGFTERQVRVMAVENSRGLVGVATARSEGL
jgi:hypothetical protein